MKAKILLLAAALSSSWVHADLVVIAHPTLNVNSLSQSELNRLFMGQSAMLPNGGRALPLDIADDTRNLFYQQVLNKQPAQVEKYWARMVFTGKAQPPRAVKAREIKNIVAETPGAISYIERDQADASVKVLKITP